MRVAYLNAELLRADRRLRNVERRCSVPLCDSIQRDGSRIPKDVEAAGKAIVGVDEPVGADDGVVDLDGLR